MSRASPTITQASRDAADRIRRDFARRWGSIGAAWGVAPSTAAVQGYLLLHTGPLTEAEVRAALGLSHRTTTIALRECESWGLIERAEPRRTGTRGPTGRAWVAIDDHWQWFLRVAATRKERETDPVLPLLDECLSRADETEAAELSARIEALLAFVRQFNRAVAAVVRADSATLARLFGVINKLDDRALDQVLNALATVPDAELARAVSNICGMRSPVLRRFIGLAGRPGLARLLGIA